MNSNPKDLFKKAFKYKLKRKHYDFKRVVSKFDPNSNIGNDFNEYISSIPKSSIVNY